jgi:predicted RNA-binding Zn-ribbon protein involved in translation (DUF1610 family)
MTTELNEGYLMIDHRASPGLPGDPLRGEGKLFETKTNHCNHCGRVVIINPLRTRDRAYCQKCLKYICDDCGLEIKLPDYNHITYKERLDDIYRLTQLTKGLSNG